jgi:AraC family transcriptional activator of pobA
MAKIVIRKTEIPRYRLENFRPLHRENKKGIPAFGYNQIDNSKFIPGFELYSSAGLKTSLGPLKSLFYRISITLRGSVDVQLGLEHFKHRPGTLSFTFPNQIFSKSNISKDAFGYYILFSSDFLNEIVPSVKMAEEFPFFDFTGTPFFQLSAEEIKRVEGFVMSMNAELQKALPGKEHAVKMYLYLLLLEARRSYERQQLHTSSVDNYSLISRYRKLVSQHFLVKRKVADYAAMLSVTPNHLNRTIKEMTATTASAAIAEMLAQEAKALLKYTTATVSEIAYQLDFSDPASFHRFFKKTCGETPLHFRSVHNRANAMHDQARD